MKQFHLENVDYFFFTFNKLIYLIKNAITLFMFYVYYSDALINVTLLRQKEKYIEIQSSESIHYMNISCIDISSPLFY